MQEKEVRRKGGGETRRQMLCQPHALPGTSSHALWVLRSPIGSSGAEQGEGLSAALVHRW